jgi:hypothetical protein
MNLGYKVKYFKYKTKYAKQLKILKGGGGKPATINVAIEKGKKYIQKLDTNPNSDDNINNAMKALKYICYCFEKIKDYTKDIESNIDVINTFNLYIQFKLWLKNNNNIIPIKLLTVDVYTENKTINLTKTLENNNNNMNLKNYCEKIIKILNDNSSEYNITKTKYDEEEEEEAAAAAAAKEEEDAAAAAAAAAAAKEEEDATAAAAAAAAAAAKEDEEEEEDAAAAKEDEGDDKGNDKEGKDANGEEKLITLRENVISPLEELHNILLGLQTQLNDIEKINNLHA